MFLQRFVLKRAAQMQSRILRIWTCFIQTLQEERNQEVHGHRLVCVVVKRSRYIRGLHVFLQWREHALGSRLLCSKTGKLILQWSRHVTSACLVAWYKHTQVKLMFKINCKKVTTRRMKKRCMKTIVAWHFYYGKQRTVAGICSRVSRRCVQLLAHSAFQDWLGVTIELQHLRCTAKKATGHVTRHCIALAFDKWLTFSTQASITEHKCCKADAMFKQSSLARSRLIAQAWLNTIANHYIKPRKALFQSVTVLSSVYFRVFSACRLADAFISWKRNQRATSVWRARVLSFGQRSSLRFIRRFSIVFVHACHPCYRT